jgi:glycine cleavage system H lipoate-binding protein
MSILIVLLMFLLVMAVSYFRTRPEVPARAEVYAGPRAQRMQRAYGFSIPEGYCFHPGHTWVMKEGGENARVGIDSFAANLLGKIDHADVVGPNRWLRQGQKLITVRAGDQSFDMVSPIEGVVTAINKDAIEDPGMIAHDPYQKGWIAIVKSPDLATNQKNLMQGGMVAPWLQNSVTRLNAMVPQLSATMAADGSLPLEGLARAGVGGGKAAVGEGALLGLTWRGRRKGVGSQVSGLRKISSA